MNESSIIIFFWKHIKPYKWHYMVMLLAPIVTGFYPFIYNYSIKLFLDVMTVSNDISYDLVIFPILLFISIQIIIEVVWRISSIAEWRSEPYVRRSIILDSYNYVQNHSYEFFQDNFTGGISSKLKGILDGYDKFWAEMHHGLLVRLLRVIINIYVLVMLNFYIGFFMFLWGVIYLPIMYRLSKKLNILAFDETECRHSLIGQISDKITNIVSLFSHSSRRLELKRLRSRMNHDFIPKQIKVYKYNFIVQMVGGFLYFIMFVFILFYTIHLRILNLVTIGDFAFVFGIVISISEDIWQATISLQDFSRAMGDLRSALSVINIPQQNLDLDNSKKLVVIDPSIAFKDVGFSYTEGKRIFNNLNMSIKSGEKIGIVGHSGSGKSSLINLLLRYFNIDRGDIEIDGQSIRLVTQDSLRENIAVIPQDTMLFHRTLMENIRYGKHDATEQQVIEASKKAHIHEYIMTLTDKYDSYVGERGIKLSGGQRQRISIARAILKDAPILILDEATSSLDSYTEKLIQDSLNFFIEDSKKTVIAIAHRLSTLKHMDRIIVLEQGDILEQGTHQELLSNDKSLYKQLWEHQEI